MSIEYAKSALLQPLDRAYKQNGMHRIEHLEVKDDGIAHTLRTGATSGYSQTNGYDKWSKR